MHRRHLLFTAVLTLLVADVAAQITSIRRGSPIQGPMRPPRDATAAPETGTARLRGVVVGGEAGLPLRRAVVHVSGERLREGRVTRTDADGRWELAELPAGRYTLIASKAGYVTLAYGQQRAFAGGRPIELREGQTLDNVNVSLPRGAVLAGRIVDEFGEPVENVFVVPMRYRFTNGRRQLVHAGRPADTDDGGRFRINGLPPGEFYLSATPRDPTAMMVSDADRSGYAPTYYPGVISPQLAQPIALGLGGEVSGLTFSLLPVRTATIEGVALDSQGRPMANAFVQLTAREAMGFMTSGGNQTREDGTFRVVNVVPGDYTLIARPDGRGRGENVEVATADITVGSEDIAGIVLTPLRGATIRGRIVLEGGATDLPAPSSIRVAALPAGDASPAFFMMHSQGEVGLDWTFELRAPSSPVLIYALGNPASEWTLKSVLVGGEDRADIGLAFNDGATISDVEVVLTRTQTHVSGSVTDDRGQPVPDYEVVLFAEDSAYWQARMSRRIALARPDQAGAWSHRGLPPGRYVAAAIAANAIEQGEERNPALLERLRAVGTPFTLGEGGRHTMQLTLHQVY